MQPLPSVARRLIRGACLGLLALGATQARSADIVAVPAVRMVVYPGDIIRDEMLVDIDLEMSAASSSVVLSRAAVVGKMARQTLLPGRGIAQSAVSNPRLVRNGAQVELVYIEGGLRIAATGSALQDGAAGDIVTVRNIESGVTVSGTILPDGTIQVKG